MIKNYLLNYYKFSTTAKGRVAGRDEYLVGLGVALLGFTISSLIGNNQDITPSSILMLGVKALIALVTIYPFFALAGRRLHDIGLSGWLVVLLYVIRVMLPLLGLGLLIGLAFIPPKLEGNKYRSSGLSDPEFRDNKLTGFSGRRVGRVLFIFVGIPLTLIFIYALLSIGLFTAIFGNLSNN